MTSRKTMKSLLMSVVAMLLCVSMLVGSTFAWFTDSVTATNNVIVAGNLDVELYYQNDETTAWEKATATSNIFKTGTLWEPGHVEVIKLKVVNEGTLALKYDLGINIVKEIGSKNMAGDPFKLSDYIKFGVVEGDQTYTREQAVAAVEAFATPINKAYTVSKELKPAGDADDNKIVTLVVYMSETVDNAANYGKGQAVPEIDLGLNVLATQLMHEEDSFDNTYDEDAIYYDAWVETADELYAAVAAASDSYVIAIDGNITLTKDLSNSGLNSIKLVAASEDASIDQSTYKMSFNNARVTLEGLTLTHADKPYGDGGQAGEAFSVWYASEVNYIDCTFNRSVGTLHAAVHNFIGCTFNGIYNPGNTISEYPLVNYDSKETNVINCVFNCTNRGAILFYGDNTVGEYTLNVNDTKFLGDIIDDKTAIEIHSRGTSTYNVNVKNATVGDGIINGLYRIKPANEGTVNVNVDGVTQVATASTKTELNTKISNAAAGDTVYLDTDIDLGSDAFDLAKDVTVDLNGMTLSADRGFGIVSVKNGASIKNGTIDVKSNVAAIRAFNVGSIEDVTINIEPKAAEKVATAIAIQNGGHVDSIKNVTVTGATQGIEIGKGASVDTIENVSVKAVSNGSKQGTALLINAGYVGKAVNCSFDGEAFGVHMMLNGEFTVGLELDNCKVIGGKAGIYAHDEVNIPNTTNCSLTLTYDDETDITGDLVWEFEDECHSVVTLNAPSNP